MFAPGWLGVALIPDALIVLAAVYFGGEVLTMWKRIRPYVLAVSAGLVLALILLAVVMHTMQLHWSSL